MFPRINTAFDCQRWWCRWYGSTTSFILQWNHQYFYLNIQHSKVNWNGNVKWTERFPVIAAWIFYWKIIIFDKTISAFPDCCNRVVFGVFECGTTWLSLGWHYPSGKLDLTQEGRIIMVDSHIRCTHMDFVSTAIWLAHIALTRWPFSLSHTLSLTAGTLNIIFGNGHIWRLMVTTHNLHTRCFGPIRRICTTGSVTYLLSGSANLHVLG